MSKRKASPNRTSSETKRPKTTEEEITTEEKTTTIKFFETQNPNKRESFTNLTNGTGPSAIKIDGILDLINGNPFLQILNDKNLLFYSTEHREETKRAIQGHNAALTRSCGDTFELSSSIRQSLKEIDTAWNECSELGKQFLIASVTMLADSKNLQENGDLDASFEGLSIEAIPCYSENSRSDNYVYTTQQVQICTRKLPAPLTLNASLTTIFAHEFTHAIDDTYSKLHSIHTVFANLHKSASEDFEQQFEILKCSVKLVDDDAQLFEKGYLPTFENFLRGKDVSEGSEVSNKDVVKWYANQNISDRPFQGEEGELICTTIPAEFLTFNIEHIFNTLNESKTTEEFQTKYETVVSSVLKNITSYPLPIQLAALKLVQETTKHHLDLIKSKADDSPDLQACCDIANKELEGKLENKKKEVELLETGKIEKLVENKLGQTIAENQALTNQLQEVKDESQELQVNEDKLQGQLEPPTSQLLTNVQTAEGLNKEPGSGSTESQHLKRTEKGILSNLMEIEEIEGKKRYDLNTRLTEVNGGSETLSNIEKRSTIQSIVDIEELDRRNIEPKQKPSVQIIDERNHVTEHIDNTQLLINNIKSGKISTDTVIAIERKQYGERLGMKDVIQIANILEYNEKNPESPINFPDEVKKAPIYQDAILYKTAKDHGVKVIGIEGKDLAYDKSSLLYNQDREEYMTKVIDAVVGKGYNVIAYVGSEHVAGISKSAKEIISSKSLDKTNTLSMAKDIGRSLQKHLNTSEVASNNVHRASPNNQKSNGIGIR
jgi:hypothetical protein